LRGCIGQILPTVELWQTIQTHTINAAMHDTRFDRLEARELPLVKIEISVLTPPVEIAAWQEIQLGRHGVILTKNYRSAVFLPHVATEQGWTLSETLDNLARKAGLASNDWQQGANLQVFEAELFGE